MTLPDLTQLDSMDATSYQPAAAYLLARLSRLVYYPDQLDAAVADAGGRVVHLAAGGVQAALVLVGDFSAALVFRGTEPPRLNTLREWWADWLANLSAAWCDGPAQVGDQCHCGFIHGANGILSQAISAWKKHGAGRRLWIAGHSKGGAEAQIMAAALVASPVLAAPASVYVYGAPKAGNGEFCAFLESVVGGVFRHHHATDPVPIYPHIGWRGLRRPGVYRSAGELVYFKPNRHGRGVGAIAMKNPHPLRVAWERWRGFHNGIFKLVGNRIADHSMAAYVAACQMQLTPPTIQKGDP